MTDRKRVLELFEEQKDFYNQKVENGIERYRKGDAVINVTDQNGKPVVNAKISVKQTSHEFKFGANLFMLDELETEEKNQTYKNIKTRKKTREGSHVFFLVKTLFKSLSVKSVVTFLTVVVGRTISEDNLSHWKQCFCEDLQLLATVCPCPLDW